MPKAKTGSIPTVRLSDARRVRDGLRATWGDAIRVTLTIKHSSFAVLMRSIGFSGSSAQIIDGVPILMEPVDRTKSRS